MKTRKDQEMIEKKRKNGIPELPMYPKRVSHHPKTYTYKLP